MLNIALAIFVVFMRHVSQEGRAAADTSTVKHVYIGEKVMLSCENPLMYSEEETTVQWKLGEKEICYVYHGQVIRCDGYKPSSTNTQVSLMIPEATISASGQYSCRVFYKKKSINCFIELNVTEMARSRNGGSSLTASSFLWFLTVLLVTWNLLIPRTWQYNMSRLDYAIRMGFGL